MSAIETQNIGILKAVSVLAFGNVVYMSSQMPYFGRRSNILFHYFILFYFILFYFIYFCGRISQYDFSDLNCTAGEDPRRLTHRIRESLELKWAFKGHLVQLPCNEQGHPRLDQVALDLIQPYL